MSPTNLPVQPSTAATPAQGSAATTAEQTQPADFLAMLGQLVAASVQKSGVSPPPAKLPLVALDGQAKKEEADPEQLLAMFSMVVPAQVHPINIDVPVGQALQALSSDATNGAVQNMLQQAVKQMADGKLIAEIGGEGSGVGVEAMQAEEGAQAPTFGVQLQQQHAQVGSAQAHLSRPVHAPVGTAAWADEIGARVVMMSESGNHTASLKLSPEHLGPLEINIQVRDDKASVWFGAAHADTRAAIENALPRLREMFEAQGLSLSDAGVFREPPREQPVVKHATTSAGPGEAAEEAVSGGESAKVGLVDAYA